MPNYIIIIIINSHGRGRYGEHPEALISGFGDGGFGGGIMGRSGMGGDNDDDDSLLSGVGSNGSWANQSWYRLGAVGELQLGFAVLPLIVPMSSSISSAEATGSSTGGLASGRKPEPEIEPDEGLPLHLETGATVALAAQAAAAAQLQTPPRTPAASGVASGGRGGGGDSASLNGQTSVSRGVLHSADDGTGGGGKRRRGSLPDALLAMLSGSLSIFSPSLSDDDEDELATDGVPHHPAASTTTGQANGPRLLFRRGGADLSTSTSTTGAPGSDGGEEKAGFGSIIELRQHWFDAKRWIGKSSASATQLAAW
jgi:hypothetical protein